MLLDEIRKRMTEATKSKNETDKSILRYVMGWISTEEGRTGKTMTDEEIQKTIRKVIENNTDTMSHMPTGASGIKTIIAENECLLKLLPTLLTREQIKDELYKATEGTQHIIVFGKEGQAIGTAMKYLKGKPVASQDVIWVVQEMRKPIDAEKQ